MKERNPDNLYHNSKFESINYCIAKGDTGASSHYWRGKDKEVLKNTTKINGPAVKLPNDELIYATEQGDLPISTQLSTTAQKAMILPNLHSSSLISIGQLCDDGCSILLDKNKLWAIKNNIKILEDTRNQKDGLWDIPIGKTTISKEC